MTSLCIFHKFCPDGTVSSWCIKHFSRKIRGKVEYLPASYEEPAPNVSGFLDVFIVDFSFSARELFTMLSQCSGKIVLLDHHQSAFEKLKGVRNGDRLEIILDNERAGGQITWDYFSDKPRPWFVDYICDRDLWRFEMPNSKAVNKALLIEKWLDRSKMDQLLNLSVDEFAARGEAYLRDEDAMLRSLSAKAGLVNFEGYRVLAVNSPVLMSEIGNVLAERNCDFSLIWRYDYKKDLFFISLRGSDRSPDLSKIAEKYGGGGHPKACGFTVKNFDFIRKMLR